MIQLFRNLLLCWPRPSLKSECPSTRTSWLRKWVRVVTKQPNKPLFSPVLRFFWDGLHYIIMSKERLHLHDTVQASLLITRASTVIICSTCTRKLFIIWAAAFMFHQEEADNFHPRILTWILPSWPHVSHGLCKLYLCTYISKVPFLHWALTNYFLSHFIISARSSFASLLHVEWWVCFSVFHVTRAIFEPRSPQSRCIYIHLSLANKQSSSLTECKLWRTS